MFAIEQINDECSEFYRRQNNSAAKFSQPFDFLQILFRSSLFTVLGVLNDLQIPSPVDKMPAYFTGPAVTGSTYPEGWICTSI